MGPTLASFHERAATDAFAAKHDGKAMSLKAVNLAVLDSLNAEKGIGPWQTAGQDHV